MNWPIAPVLLCVLAFANPFRLAAEAPPIHLALQEVSLGKFIQQMFPDNPAGLFASADCRHVQFLVKQPGHTTVYVDGVAAGQFDTVEKQSIGSIDGRFAFVARRARRSMAVIDGHEGKSYFKIDSPALRPLIFSPDGKRFAYDAVDLGHHRIVLDGVEGKTYDDIIRGTLVFSEDSKHLAYEAKRDHKFFVILDTNEVAEGDHVATIAGTGRACGICFSADGQHLAYTIERGGNWHVVSDGVPSPPYATYGMEMSITFSPDGRRLAYEFGNTGANLEGPALLVIDGKTNWLPSGGPYVFSPDGKHFAYAHGNKSNAMPHCSVVMDGTNEYPGGSSVDSLVFSPDSRRLAYTVHLDSGQMVAVNGQGGKTYTDIGPELIFSTNSEHFVYFARQESGPKHESQFFMVMDDHVTPLGDSYPRGFTFSPDGKHWALARPGSKSGLDVLLDGRTIGNYFDLEMPSEFSPDDAIVFSPDSRHIAFRAISPDKSSTVVVDGVEQKINGRDLFWTTLAFDSPTHLHGLGLRGDQIFRYEIDVLPGAK